MLIFTGKVCCSPLFQLCKLHCQNVHGKQYWRLWTALNVNGTENAHCYSETLLDPLFCYSPVLILAQLLDHALLHHDVQNFFVFFFWAIADMNALRLAQLGIAFNELPHLWRQALQVPLDNFRHDVDLSFQLWGHYCSCSGSCWELWSTNHNLKSNILCLLVCYGILPLMKHNARTEFVVGLILYLCLKSTERILITANLKLEKIHRKYCTYCWVGYGCQWGFGSLSADGVSLALECSLVSEVASSFLKYCLWCPSHRVRWWRLVLYITTGCVLGRCHWHTVIVRSCQQPWRGNHLTALINECWKRWFLVPGFAVWSSYKTSMKFNHTFMQFSFETKSVTTSVCVEKVGYNLEQGAGATQQLAQQADARRLAAKPGLGWGVFALPGLRIKFSAEHWWAWRTLVCYCLEVLFLPVWF